MSARLAAAALLLAGALTACGGDADAQGSRPTVTVLAAASLTEVFERLGADVPGATVRFSFGPSSGVATQVLEGAPADVLATASRATMQTAVDGGVVETPVPFARNRLQLVVPAGNPAGVRGLPDLARPELRVALCAEQVPCGSAALQVLEAAGVRARPDTLEPDVKAVLAKVTLGEVDAALVYRTDVLAAGDAVEGFDAGATAGVATEYLVAVVADSPHPQEARRFVELLRAPAATAVLEEAGFEPVP